VIRILVNHDLVGIPQPVTAIAQVERRDAEVEASEPESRRASSCQVPDVMRTESAGEMAVLPGMIEVVMRIVAAGIVADSRAVRMNVGSIRMALFIRKGMIFLDRVAGSPDGSGTVSRRMRGGAFMTAWVSLRKGWKTA
jgi:hypothetical protein